MVGLRFFGPVFVYDMLALARRWQVFAARAGFVLLLLIGMAIAWSNSEQTIVPVGGSPTLAQLAKIGEAFFYALAGIQVSFLLLSAPAAAAGSICIDRARGTLLHMMVTDLSDTEIVLGRLGARLMPVFGLVASGVPVLALAGLLGGIDFGALVGLFVVSITLGVLGCSLALAISIRASKTHEVLMAVYLTLGGWLLILPIWWILSRSAGIGIPPLWLQKGNPFVLVYAPYTKPGFVGWGDFAIFCGITTLVSAGLVVWSIFSLRRSVVASTGQNQKFLRRPWRIARFWPSAPGPALDPNPVLWREWHRNQPSRMARRLWLGLGLVCWSMTGLGVWEVLVDGTQLNMSTLTLGLLLQLFFGSLMVASTSATVLAEERTRGSLDILLSTPLSTASILFAKWWGTYRMVLGLAVLPAFVAIFHAAVAPDLPPRFAGSLQPVAVTMTDRWASATLTILDFLVSGALIVSIGVAVATWVPRLGRAVATSVSVFVLLGIGWPIFVETFLDRFFYSQMNLNFRGRWVSEAFAAFSPIFGPMTSIQAISGYAYEPRDFLWDALVKVELVKFFCALVLFALTLKTFNRSLGRVVESRPPSFRPPAGPKSSRSDRKPPSIDDELALASVSDSRSPLP